MGKLWLPTQHFRRISIHFSVCRTREVCFWFPFDVVTGCRGLLHIREPVLTYFYLGLHDTDIYVHTSNVPAFSFLERFALVSGKCYEKREEEEKDQFHEDSLCRAPSYQSNISRRSLHILLPSSE